MPSLLETEQQPLKRSNQLSLAVGAVAGLYRTEILIRPGAFWEPYTFASAQTPQRTEIWQNLAIQYEEPINTKMLELRQVLVRSYKTKEPYRIAPIFAQYFSQETLNPARQFVDFGSGFSVHFGIGERELFLADVLADRVNEGLEGLKLQQAKSVILGELLGKNVDMVHPEYKRINPDSDEYLEEIFRTGPLSASISKFTFGDIIEAVLTGKVNFSKIAL